MRKVNTLTGTILLILIIFLIIIFKKESSLVQREIISYIEKNCIEVECEIRLSSLTNFEWDSLYYFQERALLDSQLRNDKLFPFDVPKSEKLMAGQMIFVKNNQVVHFEEIERGVDQSKKNEISFNNSMAVEGMQFYTPETAVFSVKNYSNLGFFKYRYYALTAIKL